MIYNCFLEMLLNMQKKGWGKRKLHHFFFQSCVLSLFSIVVYFFVFFLVFFTIPSGFYCYNVFVILIIGEFLGLRTHQYCSLAVFRFLSLLEHYFNNLGSCYLIISFTSRFGLEICILYKIMITFYS